MVLMTLVAAHRHALHCHSGASLWKLVRKEGRPGGGGGGGRESSCEVLRKNTWRLWLTSGLTRTHGQLPLFSGPQAA